MTLKECGKPIEILLVEDTLSDVTLMREALKGLTAPYQLAVVGDGEQALAYLRREGAYATTPRPDLILLDLNLPKKDGRQVLAEIKTDATLQAIPVIVWTISDDQHDIAQCYQHHVNSYIIKLQGFDPLLQAIKAVEDFWWSVVTLFEEEERPTEFALAEDSAHDGTNPADSSRKRS